jgi:hypothetical protein
MGEFAERSGGDWRKTGVFSMSFWGIAWGLRNGIFCLLFGVLNFTPCEVLASNHHAIFV